MSISKDYIISFILSLAFWIILMVFFSISIKTPKQKEQELILLTPQILQVPKQPTIPKSIKKSQANKIVKKPTQNLPKPLKNISQKPIAKTITNVPNVDYKTIPSKAPETAPTIPTPIAPKTKPLSKHIKSNKEEGDYFKNAYTPAKAIYSPKPNIPQSLLPSVKELVIRVKFFIKKDGSCTAMLLTPTPNPQLNALLKKEFSNWKFFPATKGQNPIDSTMDLVIRIKIE